MHSLQRRVDNLARAIKELTESDIAAFGGDRRKLIKQKREEMHRAADELDFETAALLRDEIAKIEAELKEKPKEKAKDKTA